MGVIRVNPQELKREEVPEGIHPAVIANIEETESKKGKPQIRWDFRIEGSSDPTLEGRMVFDRQSIAPGEGDFYLRRVRDLGGNPAEFDTDSVLDMPVFIRVTHSVGKQVGPDGAPTIFVNVAQVTKR